jgi:hypothetical protein
MDNFIFYINTDGVEEKIFVVAADLIEAKEKAQTLMHPHSIIIDYYVYPFYSKQNKE